MSGPFQVGDVVVCVDDGPAGPNSTVPEGTPFPLKIGSIGRVRRTTVNLHGDWISFVDSGPWFGAHRFRHLPRATDEFTAEMRALRPIKETVDA